MSLQQLLAAIASLLIVVQAQVAQAGGLVVLKGYPQSRVSSTGEGTERRLLSGREAGEFSVRIEIDSTGQLVLATREGQPLVHQRAGIYHLFFHIGGFIKVLDPGMKEAMDMQGPDYVEVLHTFLGTVSYWGKVELFRDAALDQRSP